MDATKFLVANMVRSIARKLEVEMFYGQMGYGTVASTAGNVVTITTAEWAPGIWVGGENMPIEFRDATGATLRGPAAVTSVDMLNQTITVNALPAGVIATDTIWHLGAYGNEFAGVHKILTNTGTLFNINASQFALWSGNTYSAGSAALSFAKIESAVARAVEKGLDSNVMVLVNPRTWANLLTDQASLRRYDGSYKQSEMDNGAESLKFYGQNGIMEIIPSIFVKQGYAFILCKDEWIRVGSTDVTFRRPGQGDEFFRELENSAGYELRAFSDQAAFTYAPGRNVIVKDIVNS